jgi:hypothetical protein
MEGLITVWMGLEQSFGALLYHPQRPCANPGGSAMMNKQQAIGVTKDHG